MFGFRVKDLFRKEVTYEAKVFAKDEQHLMIDHVSQILHIR
jgi:hypothetical protein